MNDIYTTEFTPNWKYQLKYELCSYFGRMFYDKKPPVKSYLLHLGCGNTYLDNFVNADFFYLRWVPFIKQQYTYDWLLDFRYPFKCPDNYWDGVFSEHTIEHLRYHDCLNLFKELYRTMKPGAWLRIAVPGLEESLNSYAAADENDKKTKAEFIYNLTQNYGHVSVWDADLMIKVLNDAGFTIVMQAQYLQGNDSRLLQDNLERRGNSLYMEAQKEIEESI